MADITLGGLTLPEDLEWVDEFQEGSDLVGQNVVYSVTGALIFQASAKQAGRAITLQGSFDGSNGFAAISLSTLEALRTLAQNPGMVYTLDFGDGRVFSVIFDRSNGPAVSAEAIQHIVPHQATDFYFPTINLLQVA